MGEKLSINNYLVAFVDILGFGKRALSVNSDEELRQLHREIKHIHDVFDKNPNSPLQENEALASRRRVLALSDALVIATALNSPLSKNMGVFDNWCGEVNVIGINQAICAANGIFLRGGLSKGQFFFENDILVSAALVKAYEIETKIAKWPVICVDEGTYSWFSSHPSSQYYSKDDQPVDHLFMEYEPSQGVTRHCVDYIRIGIHAAYDEFTPSDRQECLKHTGGERTKIRETIARGHSKDFLMHHKAAILKQGEANPAMDHDVAVKYDWLNNYHNTVAGEWFPDDPECKI